MADPRIIERRRTAQLRMEARTTRTDEQQIEYLKARGHGHCAEVGRLQKRIAEAKQPKGKKS